ncbi:malate dehydrogenase [Candidatus Adlerbacteria bacterium RIFOXYC1_FULL_48_26]|uniref:Malate dehydrogenase n=1 Tax=Candidatus Adlerbacteria bacterium RIFOXYC1_FULL_48_26 TaxID=1797247 RepID=A0A1F4Y2J6_9BACT|nr:MAG: malate dehydrogenase [Candidatus Adlerbacteria bacterium RIFOXYC1_FULL_48_26]OGC93945.1 MAG: malate dehydrogenase [Candidatus Adlerbacteria bacterium RIFOXYB1_FULL_48_10]
MKKTDTAKRAIALHKKWGGKIRIAPTTPIKNRADMSLAYTPGVAAVSMLVAKNKKLAREYTIKGKMIAVISDGSAVLGLGNIGALGALPVMEGKAALFKTFANVDAFPIVLDTQNVDEVVETIIRIAPAFGGINLEDFAAPNCFEIEDRVKAALDIPVMHDDQHGTAIAVLAALINAAKVVKKDFKKLKVVVAGAGAAGTAVTKLLLKAEVKDIIVLDRKGTLSKKRTDLTGHKKDLADKTNPRDVHGSLQDALTGADVVLGVSGPGLMSATDVRLMAKNSIVLAMANPTPEIMPEEAKKGGAAVIGTGRSDYPNQINNSLVFPGVFRGALDNKVTKITDDMKLKAAKNLAALVKKPTAEKIVPGPFDKGVVQAVAKAIK